MEREVEKDVGEIPEATLWSVIEGPEIKPDPVKKPELNRDGFSNIPAYELNLPLPNYSPI